MRILLAKFRVKENPCLTSAPYQGAPNASRVLLMLVKKIPALRPPLIKGLQMLANFFVV